MPIYFTNQATEVVKILNQIGYFIGDEKFVDKDFLHSYQWMIKQMDKRLNNNGLFPVWLWMKKPNLKHESLFQKGTKIVCLTV
ncbi:DUF3841 domain-containing protein [Niallia sp. Sow4_A1]|jgi:hypothetical protein|uniref:DUF3841 domain-containing protein n=1 Tax=Niallia hominis TaxID=3133173 RepID=A0ABV1EVZ4_9BACI|nr:MULTISPECIES: DUF3841 domain-containing protein [Bacillaceae]MCM3361694.1 DUF3841 domain-containing protein [Niallia sp. MER TA 168]CAI9391019.1 hypothetical protein BACSP_02864 [Bacillus sp. T2.9-1]